MTSPIKFDSPASKTWLRRFDLGSEGNERSAKIETKKFGIGKDEFVSAEGKLYTEYRQVTGKKESEQGTTYLMQHQVKRGASGKIESKLGGGKAELDVHLGNRFESQVTVPKGSNADPAKIDSRRPETMPEGSSVTMKKESFVGVELSAEKKVGIKGVGVDVKGKLSVEAAKGNSVHVEKLAGNRVRVTEGPHEALRANLGAGLKAGELEAGLSMKLGAERAKLKQAEFDLNTADGRNAYAEYQKTGKLPQDSWSIKEERVDGKVRVDLKGLGLGVAGEVPLFNATQRTTKQPDGSKMVETEGVIPAPPGSPLQGPSSYRERRVYDKDGNEDVSKRYREITLGGVKLEATGERQFDYRKYQKQVDESRQMFEQIMKNPESFTPRQVPGNPYLIYG